MKEPVGSLRAAIGARATDHSHNKDPRIGSSKNTPVKPDRQAVTLDQRTQHGLVIVRREPLPDGRERFTYRNFLP
jgi:hypothetical protein